MPAIQKKQLFCLVDAAAFLRLEANAPGGCIYISRAAADALEGRIRVASLGDTIKRKGKKEGFEIL